MIGLSGVHVCQYTSSIPRVKAFGMEGQSINLLCLAGHVLSKLRVCTMRLF